MATINSGNSTTLYSTTQTTTSVNTATNLPAPQVNETNFTTLYSNSSAAATGGGTSGNLLVSGNLRVLGTSDLEGAVTIGNSYILPTSDGTSGQVVVTDGSGNLTFQNVSSISSYTIQADTAIGGADLTLVGLSTTDSVKFAEGTNISIVRTDADTITISTAADVVGPSSSTDNAIVRFDGTTGKLIQNSTVTIADTTGDITTNGDIAVNGGDITTTQTTASLFNATATTVNIGNGADTALNLGSPTGGSTVVVKSAELVGIAATQNIFNTVATTINLGNGANTALNLGSPTGGSKVVIKPETIVGINTTQNVFDTIATTVNAFGAATSVTIGAPTGTTTIDNNAVINGTGYVESDLTVNNGTVKTNSGNVLLFDTTATTVDAFGAATSVTIGAATGTTTIEHDLTVNGGNINLNGAATAGVMPFLTFANQASGANPMYGIRGKSTANDPWFVGSGSVGTDQGYLEIATGDNAGDTPGGGGSPIYARQYNGYAGTGVPWYGGDGIVVNEFVLLDENGDTSIPNNLTVGSDLTVTGTNINTGATDTIIQIDKTSSDTAISNRALKLLSTSTGTPTVGFGTALGFQGQTGVSTVKDAAYIAIASTDVTAGSEDFTMSFGLMQNGAAFSNKMELNSAGDLIIDGQFDATRIDIDGRASIDTATITTTAITTVPLTISLTRNAMSGLVNIIQGSNVHCLNFTALRVDATTALLTTYGEMYNNISLGSFTADVSGGSLRLLVTPSSATSTVFSAVRTSLT